MSGILGRKTGMTRVFTENGNVVPVTIIDCSGVTVVGYKNKAKDGHNAICLSIQFGKTKSFIREFPISDNLMDLKSDDVISVSQFSVGDTVRVVGRAKGKGFQGVIKRHGFGGGRKTHGSTFHRKPGSIGTMKPSRVVKGLRMAGRMGGQQVTFNDIQIISVDGKRELLYLSGCLPGAKNSFLKISV